MAIGGNITFGNVTLWGCGNGAGWTFTPSSIQATMIEKPAPIGTGYWLKPKALEPCDHTLELKWASDDPRTISNLVEGINQYYLATLFVPSWGSYTNCRLVSYGNFEVEFLTSEGVFVISNTLTFRQYP